MEYIKIIFEKDSFRFINNESLELFVIGHLLISDVCYSSKKFINWTSDTTQTVTDSNATYLEKKGNMIYIRDLFEEEGPCFGYKIPEFIQMLKEWNIVIKQNPKEILITKDGDCKITIEGIGKLIDLVKESV